jgi:hypothetical protein
MSNYPACIDLHCRWVRRARLQDDVASKLSGVVAATIDIYNSIRAELLPTPAKSHYTYNMRDLSKVFQVSWCYIPHDSTY